MQSKKICTCVCHVPGSSLMHFRPCCGQGSDQPDVSPPQSLQAYAVLHAKLETYKAQVKKLEQLCTMDGIEDLIKTRDRQRALLQKAHEEFAKTDHWYHMDIKDELAKELGL